MRAEVEIGSVLGNWTVLAFERCAPTFSSPAGRLGARCQCVCGTVSVVTINNLRTGNSTSCRVCRSRKGAAARVEVVWPDGHRMSGHELFATWKGMMARCYNPRATDYDRYGGRNIQVCERWRDARQFVEDIESQLGPRPEGCTLDRYPDPDGNYEQGNVRWADGSQQRANRSSV